MGINGTPFTLVVSLPHNYGSYRVSYPVEFDIHRIRSNDKGQHTYTQFFTGNWTIHPDWYYLEISTKLFIFNWFLVCRHYCRYLDDKLYFETANDEFLYFLKKMEGPGWKWSRECEFYCQLYVNLAISSCFRRP